MFNRGRIDSYQSVLVILGQGVRAQNGFAAVGAAAKYSHHTSRKAIKDHSKSRDAVKQLKKIGYHTYKNMSVKIVTDAVVLMSLTAGVGYLGKRLLKENFLGDPSSNLMNYGKFNVTLAGSMALKTYLEDNKIIPKNL